MPLALLALALAGVAWLFGAQGRPIPRAAADGKSEAPRTRFRTWLRTAVPLFLLQPLMGLALLGRVDGIVHLPPNSRHWPSDRWTINRPSISWR